jgi:hypothetical protein
MSHCPVKFIQGIIEGLSGYPSVVYYGQGVVRFGVLTLVSPSIFLS